MSQFQTTMTPVTDSPTSKVTQIGPYTKAFNLDDFLEKEHQHKLESAVYSEWEDTQDVSDGGNIFLISVFSLKTV